MRGRSIVGLAVLLTGLVACTGLAVPPPTGAGTSPALPGQPRATATDTGSTAATPSLAPPNFSFSFPTEPGPTYLVEFKTNLPDPSWQTLTNFIGTGELIMITDDGQSPGPKFYRIHLQ